MSSVNKMQLYKQKLEKWLAEMPIMKFYFKVFILGNLIVGVTSGIFLRFFFEVLKYVDYQYYYWLYAIRILMYFWLVFYAAVSLITALTRSVEMPKWAETSVYIYVLISMTSLYMYETFMPFQALGSEIFGYAYRYFRLRYL